MSSLLIISTIVCFAEYITPIFVKYLTTSFYSESKADQVIREEIAKLDREMSGISVVNEFARFTRLKRRHAKLMEEWKNNVSARLSSRTKVHLILTYSYKLISVLVSLILMYVYRAEPVVVLPQSLLWPFQNLLSWPGSNANAISLASWMILTRIVAHACKDDFS